MERFTRYNFTLISFYLLLFSLCNLSVPAASSSLLTSNRPTDENNLACAAVNCGQGTCKPLNDIGFGFECDCNPGWRKIQIGPLTFPSCVIPDCSMDFQCDSSSSPAPLPPLLNPNCLFVWCGDGTCISNTSGAGYTCQCPQGSENFFDNPTFACVKSCAFGVDCQRLGLGLPITPTTPSPSGKSGSTSKAGAPPATPASPPPTPNKSGSTTNTGLPGAPPATPPSPPPTPNKSGSTTDTGTPATTPVAPPPPSKLGSTVDSGPDPASNCSRNLPAPTMMLLATAILAWF